MRKVQFVESGEISSNRTFMELKYGRMTKHCGHEDCSNRTFMELKF